MADISSILRKRNSLGYLFLTARWGTLSKTSAIGKRCIQLNEQPPGHKVSKPQSLKAFTYRNEPRLSSVKFLVSFLQG